MNLSDCLSEGFIPYDEYGFLDKDKNEIKDPPSVYFMQQSLNIAGDDENLKGEDILKDRKK